MTDSQDLMLKQWELEHALRARYGIQDLGYHFTKCLACEPATRLACPACDGSGLIAREKANAKGRARRNDPSARQS